MSTEFTTAQLQYLDLHYRQPPPRINGAKTFAGALTLENLASIGLVHTSAAGLLTTSLLAVGDVTPGTASQVLTTNGAGTAAAWAKLLDANIDSTAAIARSKLASGTNYRILANSAAGVMSENAALTANYPVIADANGQLTTEQYLSVSRGGTGVGTFTSNGILYGNAAAALQVTAQGADSTVLAGTGGVPAFQQIDATAFFAAGAATTASGTVGALSPGAIPGDTTGTEAASTYVGENFGTKMDGGGGGFAYDIYSTTALTNAFGSVVSTTLNKGRYLIGYRVNSTSPDAALRTALAYLNVGPGSDRVTNYERQTAEQNVVFNLQDWMIPVTITADSTSVSVQAYIDSLAGASSNNYHVLRVVRFN